MTETAARSWTLELPYDRPPLHLNQRMHHMKAHQLGRQVIDDVTWLARAAKLPKGDRGLRRCHIELVWTPSTKRTRDTDNPTPTLKKVIDALVRYGLVLDDHSDIVESAVRIRTPISGRGRVQVVITEVTVVDSPRGT